MKIQILGTGCHTCLALEMRVAQVIAPSGRTDVQVKREEERIIRHPIHSTTFPHS